MKRQIIKLGAVAGLALALFPTQAKATIPVAVVADPYQIFDTTVNWTQWLADRVEQLNQLSEMIENNALTSAIRGLNEIQTSLQTDISEVMGTVATLADTPNRIFDSVRSVTGGVYGMFNSGQSWLSSFQTMFDPSMDALKQLSLSQLGDTNADMSYINNNGGSFGFMNKIGGMKTALNTAYLSESKQREQKLQGWEKSAYGGDAVQMQSTQLDMMGEMVRQNYRAEEMKALDRVYENTEHAAMEDQLRARRSRTSTQTENWYQAQINF